MIKKGICFAAVFLLLLQQFAPLSRGAGGKISVSAQSAVLMNADTLEVLYAKAADAQRPMASTTKIMTALLALEYGQPQLKITAPAEAVQVEGTSIGLMPGDEITLKTLVYGMLLESGNDAANVTAYAVSGGIEPFCALMNERAKELGMNNTSFANPSGLPCEGHYSTAYDMAVLASYAINQPSFYEICSKKTAQVSFGTPECTRTFTNHNKLLSMYDGAVGLKTGFTKSSGRCLVSAARRNGVTLTAVTLNAPDDWNDHISLLNYGFSVSASAGRQPAPPNLTVPVVGSDVYCVGVYSLPPAAEVPADCDILYFTDRFLYAPVKRGDAVGCGIIRHKNGKEISRFMLYAAGDAPRRAYVRKQKPSKAAKFFERLKKFFVKGLPEGK